MNKANVISKNLSYRIICDIVVSILKSSILFLGSKNTHNFYFESDFYLIHLLEIHRSYLIYFQRCNMLKILSDKNSFKKLSLLLQNAAPGLSAYQSIFDLFKLFWLASGSLLNYLFSLDWIHDLPPEQNTLDYLSELEQFFPWCHSIIPWTKVLVWLHFKMYFLSPKLSTSLKVVKLVKIYYRTIN